MADYEFSTTKLEPQDTIKMLSIDGSNPGYMTGAELKRFLAEQIYPIGSIYLSISNESPSSFIGGDWTLIDSGLALWTASSGAGDTIEAGLPNISGNVSFQNGRVNPISADGALYVDGGLRAGSYSDIDYEKYYPSSVLLDASRSNPIYGKSTTVQPPAYKVYAWRRIA